MKIIRGAVKKHGFRYEEFSKDLDGVDLYCPECSQKSMGARGLDFMYCPYFAVINRTHLTNEGDITEGTRYTLKCTCCGCEFYIIVGEK